MKFLSEQPEELSRRAHCDDELKKKLAENNDVICFQEIHGKDEFLQAILHGSWPPWSWWETRQDWLLAGKRGASQGSPLRMAPGVPLGMGGDPEPVQMILPSTITSVWGSLPPAAT